MRNVWDQDKVEKMYLLNWIKVENIGTKNSISFLENGMSPFVHWMNRSVICPEKKDTTDPLLPTRSLPEKPNELPSDLFGRVPLNKNQCIPSMKHTPQLKKQ